MEDDGEYQGDLQDNDSNHDNEVWYCDKRGLVPRFVTDNVILDFVVYDRLRGIEICRKTTSAGFAQSAADVARSCQPSIFIPMRRMRALEITLVEKEREYISVACAARWER